MLPRVGMIEPHHIEQVDACDILHDDRGADVEFDHVIGRHDPVLKQAEQSSLVDEAFGHQVGQPGVLPDHLEEHEAFEASEPG